MHREFWSENLQPLDIVWITLKYILKELGVKGWNGQKLFITASNVNSVNVIMYDQMNKHTLFKQDH
jgi:hypothetical protein